LKSLQLAVKDFVYVVDGSYIKLHTRVVLSITLKPIIERPSVQLHTLVFYFFNNLKERNKKKQNM